MVQKCLPSIAHFFTTQLVDYSNLILLRDLASEVLHRNHSLLQSNSLSLSLPLVSSYSKCILYVVQTLSVVQQYLQILSNPRISPSTFNQLLSDSHTPVETLLQFLYHVIDSSRGVVKTEVWSITREQVTSLAVFQGFLRTEGGKGDLVWRRNHNILITRYDCMEMEFQLLLLICLLRVNEKDIIQQDALETSSQQSRLECSRSLCTTLQDTFIGIQSLSEKVDSLCQRIEADGYLGTPSIHVEGDTNVLSSSSLTCLDNHALWNSVKRLREECMDVFKHITTLARPQKSLLCSIVFDHHEASIQKFIEETVAAPSSQKNILSRILHLQKNIRIVTTSDFFVTGIVNPAGEKSDSPVAPLAPQAESLREKLETSSSQAMKERQEMLERTVKEAEDHASVLQREVMDLTHARTLLLEQLVQKKEALELRMNTTGDDEMQLREALEKKRNEAKALLRESTQLKKELIELRSRPEQRSREDVSNEKVRLMKR